MHNPRVLFVCGGTTLYGAERVVLRYIQGLYRLGFPLRATANGWTDGNFARELDAIGVPYDLIKLGWLYLSKPAWTWDTLRNYPGAVRHFQKVVRQFQPDLIVHSGYRTLAMLAWRLKDNNIVAVQDYWKQPWEHRLIRRLDRKVRAYISCSDDISRHLRDIGLPAEKIVRIYNPMTFPNQPRARAEQDRPFTFGITGQIIERKGHHVVLDALAKVRQLEPQRDVRLKVFGDGDPTYHRRLEAQVTQLGLEDIVEWAGYCTNPDDFYPQLDCALVMTVQPDPCPLAAIEPGAYSLPAITSTAGGLVELVIDGESGYLVQPSDAESLALRMRRLICNPDLACKMGNQAFWANKRRFDEPIVMAELSALLCQLAQAPSRHHVGDGRS